MRTDKNSNEQLMVLLSFIAYSYLFDDDQEKMKSAINRNLKLLAPDQELVWGAVTGKDTFGSNVALIYIARDQKQNEYTAVARGTNPFSIIQSWWAQDLVVAEKVLWTEQSPASPAKDAMISEATNQSLNIHKNLRDETTKETFWEFLMKIFARGNDVTINFTGHSLGGLLAPTLALWFYEMLNTPRYKKFLEKVTMNVYAFAGPTAGDKKFTGYMEHVFTQLLPFKIHDFKRNPRDVAINVWNTDDFKDMDLEDELGLAGKFVSKRLLKIGIEKEDQAETFLWIVMAAIQHVLPYLSLIPDKKAADFIKNDIVKPTMKRIFPGKRIRDLLEKI